MLGATVVNKHYVKPLDAALSLSLAPSHDLRVTVDENAIAGRAVNECLVVSDDTNRGAQPRHPRRYDTSSARGR